MNKIVILGGGFGGVRAALDLEKKLGKKSEITLIDKNSYHLFVPSIYEVASAYFKDDKFASCLRRSVAIPYKDIFAAKKINFVQAEVTKVDLVSQIIMTKGDNFFTYDYLVLALGSQIADFGIPGVYEYAHHFRTLDDALMINEKVPQLLNKAASDRKLPIKILVCGAGFTGIELAAEISNYVRKLAQKSKLSSRPALIYIFEGQAKILANVSDAERDQIRLRLKKLGVVIMEGSPIEEIKQGMVKLKNGQVVGGDMVIWTAGLRANKFLQTIQGLELVPNGKIIIEEDLHVPNHENVFAVGDNIEFIDHKTQRPIPALAYLAVDHGAIAAENIYNSINNKEPVMHKPFYDVWVAPVGGRWALSHLRSGLNIGGLMGWVMHELISLRYFISILPINKALGLFLRDIRLFSKND